MIGDVIDPAWLAQERTARAALSFLAEPGDPALGEMLAVVGPQTVLAAATSTVLFDPVPLDPVPLDPVPLDPVPLDPVLLGPVPAGRAGSERVLRRLRSKLPDLPSVGELDLWEGRGFRLVCPGEPEWPSQLDDLGAARPIVLWLSGDADLRFACLRSAAVVGSRSATSYGSVVAAELAAGVAERGATVISGGAYGVDACAHRGALARRGLTVAVLASGLEFGYPQGHHELFHAIGETGVLVSEIPPDKAPTRPGFLIRNRLIAALSRGTVIVEAAMRSGALNTAKHARELNRPVMAVPGPVTSAQSAGCHELIRNWGAVCVTSASDVIELITPLGDDLGGLGLAGEAVLPAEQLGPDTASVLKVIGARAGRGPATIATLAGVDLDTAIRCLGLLAASGYIERCDQGWRVRRLSSRAQARATQGDVHTEPGSPARKSMPSAR